MPLAKANIKCKHDVIPYAVGLSVCDLVGSRVAQWVKVNLSCLSCQTTFPRSCLFTAPPTGLAVKWSMIFGEPPRSLIWGEPLTFFFTLASRWTFENLTGNAKAFRGVFLHSAWRLRAETRLSQLAGNGNFWYVINMAPKELYSKCELVLL